MSVNTVLSFMIGLEQSIYLSTSGIYEPSINALCFQMFSDFGAYYEPMGLIPGSNGS